MSLLTKRCRWEEQAEKALQPVEIIYYRGESDYQGSASCMVRRADNTIALLAWSWGSCSGCDKHDAAESKAAWDDPQRDGASYHAALEDFNRSVQVMDADTAIQFVRALIDTSPHFEEDRYSERISASTAEPIIARLMELGIQEGARNRAADAAQADLYRALKEGDR